MVQLFRVLPTLSICVLQFAFVIRWLKRGGLEVTYIRNVTDIDDKILRSLRSRLSLSGHGLQRYEREFTEAITSSAWQSHLRAACDRTYSEQIALIQPRLVDRGHAYSGDGAETSTPVASQRTMAQ